MQYITDHFRKLLKFLVVNSLHNLVKAILSFDIGIPTCQPFRIATKRTLSNSFSSKINISHQILTLYQNYVLLKNSKRL
jgi:hypothetical protein